MDGWQERGRGGICFGGWLAFLFHFFFCFFFLSFFGIWCVLRCVDRDD